MSGFTKLFSSIVTSSIWCESNTILRVWIAMLATADSEGLVEGSVPGFANLARVTRDELCEAIDVLSSPDNDSRTPANEGRRIETVEGGWQVLNYSAYRKRGQGKEGSRAPYYREYRRKQKEKAEADVAQRCAQQPDVARDTEAEAEADTNTLSGEARRRGKDQPHPPEVVEAAREVIDHLNAVTARNYSPTAAGNLKLIARLLNDGATVEQMKGVVDVQAKQWKGRPDMDAYLRPATLFGPDNFWTKYAGHVDGATGKPQLSREERVNETRL